MTARQTGISLVVYKACWFLCLQVTKAVKVGRAAEVYPVLMDLTVLLDHLAVKVSRELTDYRASSLGSFQYILVTGT